MILARPPHKLPSLLPNSAVAQHPHLSPQNVEDFQRHRRGLRQVEGENRFLVERVGEILIELDFVGEIVRDGGRAVLHEIHGADEQLKASGQQLAQIVEGVVGVLA